VAHFAAMNTAAARRRTCACPAADQHCRVVECHKYAAASQTGVTNYSSSDISLPTGEKEIVDKIG